MQEAAQAGLLAAIRALQTSHEFSDLKIFCGGQVFHAHKAIVCTRSAYFRAACKWNNEGELKSEVDLTSDDDPRLVKLVVDYLYQLDYDDWIPEESAAALDDELPNHSVSAEAPALEKESAEVYVEGTVAKAATNFNSLNEHSHSMTHIAGYNWGPNYGVPVVNGQDSWSFSMPKISKKDKKKKKRRAPRMRLPEPETGAQMERLTVNALMYSLADKYGIDDLKALAKDKFHGAVQEDWETAAFVRAAKQVYNTTPSSDLGLRSIVWETIIAHRRLINYAEVADLLNEGNGIAWELLRHSWKDVVESD